MKFKNIINNSFLFSSGNGECLSKLRIIQGFGTIKYFNAQAHA